MNNKGRLSTERYESLYNDNIKNKGILSRSKTLLEDELVKLHSALESVSNVTETNFGAIYTGIDDNRIREIIQSSIDVIYFTKIEKDKVLLEVKSKVGTVDEYIIETRKRKCYIKYNLVVYNYYYLKVLNIFINFI